jgi:cytochrome c553
MDALLVFFCKTLRAYLAFAFFSAGLLGSANAGDIALGQKKATAACAVCHGPLGLASMPSAPHLAGQVPDYLALQLKNYRSGRRAHEVMAVIARQLTDDDISDLAAWYGSIKISIDSRPQ